MTFCVVLLPVPGGRLDRVGGSDVGTSPLYPAGGEPARQDGLLDLQTAADVDPARSHETEQHGLTGRSLVDEVRQHELTADRGERVGTEGVAIGFVLP